MAATQTCVEATQACVAATQACVAATSGCVTATQSHVAATQRCCCWITAHWGCLYGTTAYLGSLKWHNSLSGFFKQSTEYMEKCQICLDLGREASVWAETLSREICKPQDASHMPNLALGQKNIRLFAKTDFTFSGILSLPPPYC